MNTYKKMSFALLLSLPLASLTRYTPSASNYAQQSEDYDIDSVNFDIADQTGEFRRNYGKSETPSVTTPTLLEQTVQQESTHVKKPIRVEASAQKRDRKRQECIRLQEEARKREEENAREAAVRKATALQRLEEARTVLNETKELWAQAIKTQDSNLQSAREYTNQSVKEHRIALTAGIAGIALTITTPLVNASCRTLDAVTEWAQNHPLVFVPIMVGGAVAYVFEKKSHKSLTHASYSSHIVTSKEADLAVLEKDLIEAQNTFFRCQHTYDSFK